MRSCRVNLPNRCYHLISRVAHRAFFLDEGERTRLVDLIRRVSRFSGVKLLAYSVMSNHFHVFVYIDYTEKLDDAEIVSRIAALYSDARFKQVMKKWNELAKRPDSASFRRYRRSSRREITSLPFGFCSFFSGTPSRRRICARHWASRAVSISRRRISVR